MSNTKDTGGPAFPGVLWVQHGDNLNPKGMNLRDYFAAQGLKGMLSDPNICGTPIEFAVRAYALADAMLKAREQ